MLLSVFRLTCHTPNFGQSRRKTAIYRDYWSVPSTIDSISIMEAVIPEYGKKKKKNRHLNQKLIHTSLVQRS